MRAPFAQANPDEAALRQQALIRARGNSLALDQRAAARQRARNEMDDLEAEFADEADFADEDTSNTRSSTHRARLDALAGRWESDLFGSVLPFWMRHSIDEKHGGYFTCLDRDGSVYDETKYAWLQGRQVYMLARLYNEASTDNVADPAARAAWLRAAVSASSPSGVGGFPKAA